VKLIDAESTLVSKAIHAPQKNKQLIRQAIASDKFPDLVDRIIENNGKLDFFLEDNSE
jgi:queuine/archaeosine tRNA-ribosyltransferase